MKFGNMGKKPRVGFVQGIQDTKNTRIKTLRFCRMSMIMYGLPKVFVENFMMVIVLEW